MGDFYQTGVITTLHRLGEPQISDIEKKLKKYSLVRPLSLVLPSIYAEIEGEALPNIMNVLKSVPYIRNIVVTMGQTDKNQFKKAKEFFSQLQQEVVIVWNTGPKISKLYEPQFNTIEIANYLDQFLRENRVKIADSITLNKQFEGNLHVSVDFTLMNMVFDNLLHNALKAMAGEGILSFTAYPTEEVDSVKKEIMKNVVIELEDTGCGIPKDHLNGIFEPFVSHSDGGTGLGLFHAREIIELHSGDIRVQSQVNIGTKIIIKLPVLC